MKSWKILDRELDRLMEKDLQDFLDAKLCAETITVPVKITKSKQVVMDVSKMPIVFENGTIVRYQDGRVQLLRNHILVKELPCKPKDQILYDGNTIHLVRKPKQKWRTILWEAGLTKGNWRHPKMITNMEVKLHVQVDLKDIKDASMHLWIMENGFRCWYCHAKSISEANLNTLASSLVKSIDTNYIYPDNKIIILK